MQIMKIQCFRGRNIYSHKPVIKLVVDLEADYDRPTAEIAGFNERLVEMLPGMKKHACSLGYEGGFVERLKEGTYLAHVTEHTILELQAMMGYDIRYGKARISKEPNLYYIVYQYENEKCAVETARLAVKLIDGLIQGFIIDIHSELEKIKKIATEYELGPSTRAIVEEARKRNIPVMRLGNESLVQLGYGCYQRRIQSTLTDATSCIAADIASNKLLTKQILEENGIVVPCGDIAYTENAAVELAKEIGFPVVVKPYDGNQGKGVTLNIGDEEHVRNAYKAASAFNTAVLVEHFIQGYDYRVLVVGDRVSAVAERHASCIVGDGIRTIEELVQTENASPLRGEDHERPLTKLKIDAIGKQVLNKQGFTEASVPAKRQVVFLRENANLSTGGTASDRTDMIHPYNAQIAVKAAKAVGLDIAGIDITSPDISVPIYENGGAVIEVNAAPGIRMHLYPTEGTPRDVGKDIVEMLFPDQQPYSIPIVAITGTNGKTTTTRMVSEMLRMQGLTVGMTTTSGIYINHRCILKGDNTGPNSARMVLEDRSVQAAVLETARGGIVKRGLGYDLADVGVITNITDDHLGLDGINTLEELAFTKALVAEAVKPEGYAVLNADDERVLKIVPRVKSRIIYFSARCDNPVVISHMQKGGRGVYIKDNVIIMGEGKERHPIVNVKEIPATYQGKILCNIENSIAAVSAAYGLGLPVEVITAGLKTFSADITLNPGRFNLFDLHDFKVLVDYGHNIAGYEAVIRSAQQLGAERLVGVIGIPGDRLDRNVQTVGEMSGKHFDRIYIKEDKDLRGRKQGEVAEILYRAVLKGGAAKENIDIIYDEVDALQKAMLDAHPGDLIIIFYEDFERVIECVEKMLQDLENSHEVEMVLVQQTAG